MLDDAAYRTWRTAEAALLFASQRYLSAEAYRGDAPRAPTEEMTPEGRLHLESLRNHAGVLFGAWLES